MICQMTFLQNNFLFQKSNERSDDMKLIIAENLDTAKNISSTFDYNTTIIILSKNTGEIINSIDWTELYVAVGNEEFSIADLKVAKMVNENYTADIHEISNWINELKNMYIYNHMIMNVLILKEFISKK